jgi:hypothetical protein
MRVKLVVGSPATVSESPLDSWGTWESEYAGHWADVLKTAGINLVGVASDEEPDAARVAIVAGDRLTAEEVHAVIERYPTLIVARPGAHNERLYRELGLGTLVKVPGAPREDQPHLRQNSISATLENAVANQDPLTIHVSQPMAFDGAEDAWQPLSRHGGRMLVGYLDDAGRRVVVVSSEQVFAAPFIAAHDNAQALGQLVALLDGVRLDGVQRKEVADAPVHIRSTARSAAPVGDITAVPGEHLVEPSMEALSAVLDRHLGADLDPWRDTEAFLDAARLAYFSMPTELQAAISTFKSRSNDYGALLIRNLPVGNVPRTPSDPIGRPEKTHESEFWLAMTACALGEPFAYAQEKRGNLYQNVVPTRENADKLSSESSVILLDYHTEAAFHPFKPDYVLLLCLRQDHEARARTSNAGIRMALPLLSLQDRWELQQRQFRTGVDFSFGSPNMEQGNGPLLSVLGGNPYDPELTYDLDLMVAETDAGNRALWSLRRAVAEVGSYVALTEGDLLVVDNRRAVHARSEFTPRYDGWDRWLQRMCVTRDLGLSGAWRGCGSRVIDVQFNL